MEGTKNKKNLFPGKNYRTKKKRERKEERRKDKNWKTGKKVRVTK